MKPARIGVIGLGVMGRNHARVLTELDEATLVAVCDEAPTAVAYIKKKYGTTGYTSYRQMLERETLDAVIIAVPTGAHREVGSAALASGLHVLVEKPIASDLDEASALVAAATSQARVLAVGHVERFNPAVQALKRRLDAGEAGRVFQVQASRVGPFPPRIRDVGVTVDLATHDLDVMVYLLGSEVVRLYAEMQHRVRTDREDGISALIRFGNGAVGVLDVNWLTPMKLREISVLGERGRFHVDYLTQRLIFAENDFSLREWDGVSALPGVAEGNVVQFHVQTAEPLRVELASFIESIRAGTPPVVGGADGIRALRLALELVASGERGEVRELAAIRQP